MPRHCPLYWRISLNDQLLVGPTVHSSLVDVLLRFRTHRIALITDVSRMYRAVLLDESDKDLHWFVWKQSPSEPLRDYRMTRVTFGVSASSFTANMKILFQQLWELKIGWDDSVPEPVREVWMRWRSELSLLSTKYIPRCYHNNAPGIKLMELYGVSDSSEQAHAAVLYLRMECIDSSIHVALVTAKTKVATIKRPTIPRLEQCGAHLLAQLIHHVRLLLRIPLVHSYAWTDSTIVLNWLVGNQRRFITYVGNRVPDIVELLGPDRWRHVDGMENPADCASRGVFPSELLDHHLWWKGPKWLRLPSSSWPDQSQVCYSIVSKEESKKSLSRNDVCRIASSFDSRFFGLIRLVVTQLFRPYIELAHLLLCIVCL